MTQTYTNLAKTTTRKSGGWTTFCGGPLSVTKTFAAQHLSRPTLHLSCRAFARLRHGVPTSRGPKLKEDAAWPAKPRPPGG
jgi:hypothetical protein